MTFDSFLAISQNFTGSTDMERVVHEMADRLPDAARRVASTVKWYSLGHRYHGLADWVNGQPVIMLSDGIPQEDAHSVCAHELAHVILHRDSGATVRNLATREAQAAQLTREWGFDGIGADVGGSVADALYRAHRFGVEMPTDDFTGILPLSKYGSWETGWAARSAALWTELESTFTAEQQEIFSKYQDSRAQGAICAMWARGLGGKMPKEPPTD